MKSFLIWVAAIVITLSAVVYQRVTGPTNPLKTKFVLEGETYTTKFSRSLETLVSLDNLNNEGKTSLMKVELEPISDDVSLSILLRRYPGNDSLTTVEATYKEGLYYVELPSQPPAGKIIYYPLFAKEGESVMLEKEKGIILRFKAPVSSKILIPHIILMFVAMLFSNLAGITSFFYSSKVRRYAYITVITLVAGGLFFGPLVQKAAFGAYWTGWPFGGDLTDTKTMVAVLVWIVALVLNSRVKGYKINSRRYLYTLAAVVTMLIYTIPHSTAGSEFNYSTGVVTTGVTKE